MPSSMIQDRWARELCLGNKRAINVLRIDRASSLCGLGAIGYFDAFLDEVQGVFFSKFLCGFSLD